MTGNWPTLFIPVALAVSFFIETSSWWIRIYASANNVGQYISSSNIYLYGGRFFALVFSLLLALEIESGSNPFDIALLFCISFFASSILQLPLFHYQTRRFLLKNLSVILRLPSSNFDAFNEEKAVSFQINGLFFSTLSSTVLFSVGVTIPLFIASIFIENRLAISNLGQLINSFGMIILLFFVDKKLYYSLDKGYLYKTVKVYSLARLSAFILVSFLYAGLCIVFSYE